MALRATVCKAELQLADLDRGHFADYSLTLAKHPSETDERMMVRLLAFILYASEQLSFGKGLSTDDECALSETDHGGVLQRLIEVGLPDEDRIRKACRRARHVALITYGARAAEVWWRQNEAALRRFDNLDILALSTEDSQALAALAGRNMQFACTVQEGTVYVDALAIRPVRWLTAGDGAA